MKGVVLHSGGIDSTVLLTHLLRDGHDCYPLGIEYGQTHAKELFAADHICEYLGLLEKKRVLFLSVLSELIQSALTGQGEIPRGHYSDEVQKATVVPNRNMILLAIAAGYAETIRGRFVAYAAHSNDRAIYPDCRPEFVKSVGETIRLGTGGKVELIEPFTNYTKADIVQLGRELQAPLRLTWSCYRGGERPCLTCGTCLERTEAFKLADFTDPALSEEEWEHALRYLDEYTQRR